MLLCGAVMVTAALAAGGLAGSRPNIVYFLVDDLGYANVGFTNDEPLTPSIVELHNEGIHLDSLYAYKFCSPTRSSIMSGRLPLHVNQQNHPPNLPGGGVPLGMTTMANHLQAEGYATHAVGKWHCGMSGVDRLPINRGFNSSLGYLSGAVDHYDQTRDGEVDFWKSDGPAYGLNNTNYDTFLYKDEMLRIIDEHDASIPLFLYMAFQNVHGPLQVPANYTSLYTSKNVKYEPRLMCLGMISAVDEAIGTAVTRLKATGLYENTLIIFSSDNGGPHDHANNFPYRGSKGSDWEGGTRVVAFVSGGIIPQPLRGTRRQGLMHVCDWYATLGFLAGYAPVDPKAAAAKLPPVDSINLWPWIVGDAKQSPRTEVPLSGGSSSGSGLIKVVNGTTWKLVRGSQGTSMFPGVHMPNSTDDGSNTAIDCGTGQLYNLDIDAVEHHDLSQDAGHSDVLRLLQARATALDATYFQSDGSMAVDPAAKQTAESKYGGFWGPWLPPGPVPAPPTSPPPPPPNPNPPSEGRFFKAGGLCLGLPAIFQGALAQMGPCDSTSKWSTDGPSGSVYNVAGTGRFRFIRHKPPANACGGGTPLMLGEMTDSVYTTFKNSQLQSMSCPGMCILPSGSAVSLGNCSDPRASSWQDP
mmetsp:Transcript_3291/g.8099  ORF Transcript_3291/g.8099 Transcript_3291/m.8099 type:complete len:638 (+) Transcript_3291:166-2079(+)